MKTLSRSLIQYCICLATLALAGVLLVMDFAQTPLPCWATSEHVIKSPCEQLKAQLALKLPVRPSLLAVSGFSLLSLLLVARAGMGGSAPRLLQMGLRAAWALGILVVLLLVAAQIYERAFCPWCLILASSFLSLVGLEFRRRQTQKPEPLLPYVLAFQGLMLAGFIAGATLLAGATRDGFSKRLAETLPTFIDREVLEELGPCGFATDGKNFPEHRTVQSPLSFGNPAAPVHILAFYDPFCALCRELDHNLQPVLEKNRGRLRLVSVPIPHLSDSADAVRLIYAARRVGGDEQAAKVISTLQGLIDAQPRDASRKGLQATLESAGIPYAALVAEMDSAEVTQNMNRGLEAFRAAGGTRTPLLFINGRMVAENVSSLKPACLEKLIKQPPAPNMR
jgi:uncharacterized membrane protein/glutaredoxin